MRNHALKKRRNSVRRRHKEIPVARLIRTYTSAIMRGLSKDFTLHLLYGEDAENAVQKHVRGGPPGKHIIVTRHEGVYKPSPHGFLRGLLDESVLEKP